MGVDGLEQPQSDPGVGGEHVHAADEQAADQGTGYGAHAQYGRLERMSVLGGETERGRVFMV